MLLCLAVVEKEKENTMSLQIPFFPSLFTVLYSIDVIELIYLVCLIIKKQQKTLQDLVLALCSMLKTLMLEFEVILEGKCFHTECYILYQLL